MTRRAFSVYFSNIVVSLATGARHCTNLTERSLPSGILFLLRCSPGLRASVAGFVVPITVITAISFVFLRVLCGKSSWFSDHGDSGDSCSPLPASLSQTPTPHKRFVENKNQ